ncbi:MAG: hypothetical protein COV45_06125 [Deltaproteobacteria bacterium CG11_big_fil_rev_8_21_14_0_20_47_16]|nr:MAG: hypothetical protein COV45_06125 [Deltaproteobacteria bacterium CG11_big_fil_rev_8_21_14_0_20_47_16]
MSALGYTIIALARMISLVLNLYMIVIAAAVILSWIRPDPYNPIVRFIYQLTTPVLNWARRFMPRFLWKTGIDFSPIIVFFVIILIDTVLVNLLRDWGTRLLLP